jgi:hypothetical protein
MGDSNSRIGNNQIREVLFLELDIEYTVRNSKDNRGNANKKQFLKKANDLDFKIVNSPGDKDGEFTFVNHMGASSIDLCLVGRQFLEGKYDFKFLDSHYSDHFSILSSVPKDMRTSKKKV